MRVPKLLATRAFSPWQGAHHRNELVNDSLMRSMLWPVPQGPPFALGHFMSSSIWSCSSFVLFLYNLSSMILLSCESSIDEQIEENI